MDALMAALVAALFAIPPDRAAIVVAASPRPNRTIMIAVLLAAEMATISVAMGIVIASRLAPAARLMMLALALGLIGVEFLFRALPSAPTARIAPAIVGSGLWLVVLTLAMRSSLPWLAMPGAIIGTLVTLVAAKAAGGGWQMLPLAAIRRVVGALFALAGSILACSALGIV